MFEWVTYPIYREPDDLHAALRSHLYKVHLVTPGAPLPIPPVKKWMAKYYSFLKL